MHDLEILAEKFRVQFKLGYDEKSIQYVDDLIERARSSYENKDATGVIAAMGAFLGQCIITKYGGAWEFNSESKAYYVAIDNTAVKIFPIAKTAKKLTTDLVIQFGRSSKLYLPSLRWIES